MIEEEDDFGFTTMDEVEIKAGEIDNYEKLLGLRKMIMPLLNNLKKNPEQEYIKWPDREKKIDQFIKKMDKYIDGK